MSFAHKDTGTEIKSTDQGSSLSPLASLLQELRELIPKAKEHLEKITPDAKPIEFPYAGLDDVIAGKKLYAINAACALYNAIRILDDNKIFTLTDLGSLWGNKKVISLVEQHLQSLDYISYSVLKLDKVQPFVPFEVIQKNESEYLVSELNANKNVAINQAGIRMGKMKKDTLKIPYTLDGKEKSPLSISPDYSWIPHVVCADTLKLAQIMQKLAGIITQSGILKRIEENKFLKIALKGLPAMQLVIEHILPQRIKYYSQHPELFGKLPNQPGFQSTTAQLSSHFPINASCAQELSPAIESLEAATTTATTPAVEKSIAPQLHESPRMGLGGTY